MFSIGNDKLAKLPKLGSSIACPHCGKRHLVEFGEKGYSKTYHADGTVTEGESNVSLAFYKCTTDGKVYLCGIDGKKLD